MATAPKSPWWHKPIGWVLKPLDITLVYTTDQPDYKWLVTLYKVRKGV